MCTESDGTGRATRSTSYELLCCKTCAMISAWYLPPISSANDTAEPSSPVPAAGCARAASGEAPFARDGAECLCSASSSSSSLASRASMSSKALPSLSSISSRTSPVHATVSAAEAVAMEAAAAGLGERLANAEAIASPGQPAFGSIVAGSATTAVPSQAILAAGASDGKATEAVGATTAGATAIGSAASVGQGTPAIGCSRCDVLCPR
mmetsp:Transcript_55444/g.179800  ORF Transcript_55444/g.179800 Transcript_55444/m.179800 type:complete len:209 (+) Transcript_55444:6-632(+)